MRTLCVSILTAAVAAVVLVQGYVVDPGGLRWGGARAAFQSYFDEAEAQQAVANAVSGWRVPMEGILQIDANGAAGDAAVGNGVNELAWEDLPPEVVSLTRIVSRSGRILEADISVARDGHDRQVWSMDAIMAHELGHALGLGHADDGGVEVRAAMAAYPRSLSAALTSDDRAGLIALYRSHDASASVQLDWTGQDVAFPPRNEPFAFRQQLEATYRDVLRRPSVASFVDIEGTIVWTQEYLRYRVNGCGDQDAVNRVIAQIEGRGIQPICVDFTGTTVVFPPRNEPFAFRQRLETVYRDTLRRSAVQTFVDAEGDIVWTQEYLRYRVNGCNNQQAIDRVLAQVGGGAVQPVCTSQPPGGQTIAGFLSSVNEGTTPGTLRSGPRPSPGAGPTVNITGNSTVINGSANQVRLTATQPFNLIVVGVEGVTDSFYQLQLPSAQTAVDLTISLPVQVASQRFTIEYGAALAGGPLGSYRQQPVQVQQVGTGDVQISVTWNTAADVDLHVVEPGGNEIYYGNSRSPTGGELDLDSNAACAGDNVRAENIRWPAGRAPSGTYIVRVDYWDACGAASTNFVVRVVSGSSSQTFTGTFTGSGDQGGAGSGRLITTFTR